MWGYFLAMMSERGLGLGYLSAIAGGGGGRLVQRLPVGIGVQVARMQMGAQHRRGRCLMRPLFAYRLLERVELSAQAGVEGFGTFDC